MEQQYLDADSVSKELIGPLEDFCTQIAVSEVLGKLLILVAKNRIPLRNANTIAYICQLLISSNTGVRYELNLKGGEEEVVSYINGTMEMMYGKPDNEKEKKRIRTTPTTNPAANNNPPTRDNTNSARVPILAPGTGPIACSTVRAPRG